MTAKWKAVGESADILHSLIPELLKAASGDGSHATAAYTDFYTLNTVKPGTYVGMSVEC